ncbi:MAG: asparagine synthase (glutamine-hydrolyzing) [Pseudomonadota bacterium]
MCGIAGLVSQDSGRHARVLRMSETLVHRGPDDQGAWEKDNVCLAHRRLSIMDLSTAGRQPMLSECGTWVVTYNGEIYNGEALRSALPQRQWRSHCDTEVLVEHIAQAGVTATAAQLIGMFAFAALHIPSGKLFLVRDRLGIKPLYYACDGGEIAFASELRALRSSGMDLSLNRDILAAYLRHSYVPGPATIYSQSNKLAPGHLLEIDTRTASMKPPQPYWSLEKHVTAPAYTQDAPALQRELHDLLYDAVGTRMLADVPLGAFLSGGIDSSLTCALMQAQASQPVRTFTIGFDNPDYDEAPYARAIAEHLGTDHTELYIGEADMLDAVDELPRLNDEPFADPSILPTYLVCAMAREHVTVTLSGDGADELFWGYNRYRTTERLWRNMSWCPLPLRRAASAALGNEWLQRFTTAIPAPAWGGRAGTLQQKLATAAELLRSDDHPALYEALLSHWRNPDQVLLTASPTPTVYNQPEHWTRNLEARARMAAQDTLAYLPDDILTKVDRASMRVGLEARVPLLDHRLVEFSARLPGTLKQQHGQDKYLLRRILAEYIPPALTERSKRGFGVPLDAWLRGPLRSWMGDLLATDRVRRQGLLDPERVERLQHQHVQQGINNAARLWDLLMLQLWLER